MSQNQDMKTPLLELNHHIPMQQRNLPTQVRQFRANAKVGMKITGCQIESVHQAGEAEAAGVIPGWEILLIKGKDFHQTVNQFSSTGEVTKAVEDALKLGDIWITFKTFAANDVRAPSHPSPFAPYQPEPSSLHPNKFLAACDPQSINVLSSVPPKAKAVVSKMVQLLQNSAERSLAQNLGVDFHSFVDNLLHPGEKVLFNHAVGYDKVYSYDNDTVTITTK